MSMIVISLIGTLLLVFNGIQAHSTVANDNGSRMPNNILPLNTESQYRSLVTKALRQAKQKVNAEEHWKDEEERPTKAADIDNMKKKQIEKKGFILEQTKILLEEMTGVGFTELEGYKLFRDVFRSVMHTYCLQSTVTCDRKSKYRTIDGSCNNLDNPTWGQSYSSTPRYMRPVYRDGVLLPRTTGVDGKQLPSARLISNLLMKSVGDPDFENDLTMMTMAWGQFLTHDMMLTQLTTDENESDIDCCNASETSSQCFNIEVPLEDGFFNSTCMSFTRASPGPYRKCLLHGRDPINLQTSFIDASNVYGATPGRSSELRTFVGGEMKVKDDNLPPEDTNHHSCLLHFKSHYCLRAGDDRVNVLPNIQGFHTLFLREHNRIAKALAEMNGHWTDEKIFQETRKIIGAIYQHITYTQYLPKVLNRKYLNDYKLTEVKKDIYNNTINPSIRNEFSAAAFRFGHSQVPRFMAYVFTNYTYAGKLDVKDLYGNPQIMEDKHGKYIPDFFRWLSWSLLYKTDRFFEDSVRNYLFIQNGRSFDLPALNIQRGRDHAIPPYNKWRHECGLPTARHFNITVGGLVDHSQTVSTLLSQLYRDPDDIDLYVGGLSENHIHDGLVGPTFACIIAMQFRDLRIGDRFWYERQNVPTSFTKDQLKQIKKIKLSKIICNNSNIGKLQSDVFRITSRRNKLQPCDALPDIDLLKWKDNRRFTKDLK